MSAVFQWVAQRGAKLLGSETIAAMFDTTAETLGVDETTELYNLANAAAPGGTEADATTGITGASLDNLESVEVFATPDGPELISNGTFGVDTSGWTGSNATLSVSSGKLRVTNIATGVSYAYTSFTTVIGQTYTFSLTLSAQATTGYEGWRIGESANGYENANFAESVASTPRTFTNTFVATATTTYLTVYASGATLAGEYLEWDDVSVKSTYDLIGISNGEVDTATIQTEYSVNNCTLSNTGYKIRTIVTSGGAASWAYQGFSTEVDKVYIVSVDLDAISSTGSPSIYVGTTGSSTDLYALQGIGTGTHTFKFKATTTTSYILLHMNSGATAADTADWNNISVIETDDVVADGIFNDVTNAHWTLGASWSIAGGVASCGGTTSADLEQTLDITAGKPYVVTFDISNIVGASGTYVLLGGTIGNGGSPYQTNGTKSETIIAGSSNSLIEFRCSNATAYDIDNVSIVPLVDVDTGTYSILASSAGTANARAYIDLDTQLGLTDGEMYQISINARHVGYGSSNVWTLRLEEDSTSSVAGSSRQQIGQLDEGDTTYATYTYIFKHSQYTRYLEFKEANAANTGGLFIDNITIKQVGNLLFNDQFTSNVGGGSEEAHWTQGAGWLINAGYATATTTTSYIRIKVDDRVAYGETYVLTYTVDNYSAGAITPALRGASGTARSANGTYTETFTPDATSPGDYLYFTPTGSTTLRISDVSLRRAVTRAVGASTTESFEVHGQITKTAVNTGAELMGYGPFTTSAYLEQKYNSAMDVGTGDFAFVYGINFTSLSGVPFRRRDAAASGAYIGVYSDSSGNFNIQTAAGNEDTGFDVSASTWYGMTVTRVSGVIYVYIDGVLVHSFANTNDLDNSTAVLRLGGIPGGGSEFTGYLSMFRFYASGVTALQAKNIYESEKHLFSRYAYYTESGQPYTTSTVASVKEGETETKDSRNIAIGGNIETLVDRDDEYLDVATDLIRFDALSEWREMFYALRGDTTFTFTPGQGYEPNESGFYSLENRSKREKRQNDSIYHRFDMRLRKRG